MEGPLIFCWMMLSAVVAGLVHLHYREKGKDWESRRMNDIRAEGKGFIALGVMIVIGVGILYFFHNYLFGY